MFPRRRARHRTCGTHRATSLREVDAATAGRPAESRQTIALTAMWWQLSRRRTGVAMSMLPANAIVLCRKQGAQPKVQATHGHLDATPVPHKALATT